MFRVLFGAPLILALGLILSLPAAAQLNSVTRSGLELTTVDWEMLETAAAKLYQPDAPQVGAVETWSNAESGNQGRIELLQTGEYQGMPCRKLQHEIRVKNVSDPFRFTVDRCKTPEGAWKIL
ncbi:MAG: hypothetical protein RLN99_02095 [Kiloniellaceae bacterium]